MCRMCRGDGNTTAEIRAIVKAYASATREQRAQQRAVLLRQLSRPDFQCITASLQAQLCHVRHGEASYCQVLGRRL